MKRIAIVGDYDPASETHAASRCALEHSAMALGVGPEIVWVGTEALSDAVVKRFDGFLAAPGCPYNDMARVLAAIAHARENRVPILGTCAGFQHMIVEYARNVLGLERAWHPDYRFALSAEAAERDWIISALPCSLRGREMAIEILPGSTTAALYGKSVAKERYYCTLGVNPFYVSLLENGPMRFVGRDGEGDMRILEYPGHPFFIGTLFVPQVGSTPQAPHPLLTGFVAAVTGSGSRQP